MNMIDSLIQQEDHPLAQHKGTEWADRLDMIDPMIASREVLIELMGSAPSDVAKAWLQGIFDFRIVLAAVTGRPF